jgi:RHS repeat-associated protein
MSEVGLLHYGAKFLEPVLAHFIYADTVVPSAGNVLDWNRYAYVRYNPLAYVDPSGNFCVNVGSQQICSDDPDSNGYWGNFFDRRYDKDRDGWLSKSEADYYFAVTLQTPGGRDLYVSNKFGGPCTTDSIVKDRARHAAIDFGSNKTYQAEIKAAHNGVIVGINRDERGAALGLRVMLEHFFYGYFYYSVYAHLDLVADNLTVGQDIVSGEFLGNMGKLRLRMVLFTCILK